MKTRKIFGVLVTIIVLAMVPSLANILEARGNTYYNPEWDNREVESIIDWPGPGWRPIPFVRGKNADILPSGLKKFVNDSMKETGCESFRFFWKPSPSGSIPGKIFGHFEVFLKGSNGYKTFDESFAYEVRVKMVCNKAGTLIIDKKYSDYSLMPLLSVVWHEFPPMGVIFLWTVLAAPFLIIYFYTRKK
ncbi:MAG: hypothetical protein V1690_00260 [Candidatus Moraniibacteriota bacterium]